MLVLAQDAVEHRNGALSSKTSFLVLATKPFAVRKTVALRGDFGYSYTYAQPVFGVIADRIPATLLLMIPALVVSTALGILLGVQAASHPDGPADHAILAGTLFGAAIPGFWLGQILVIVFAVSLGLLPVQGMTTARGSATGVAAVMDVIRHMVLPVVTLATLQLALITRLTR